MTIPWAYAKHDFWIRGLVVCVVATRASVTEKIIHRDSETIEIHRLDFEKKDNP